MICSSCGRLNRFLQCSFQCIHVCASVSIVNTVLFLVQTHTWTHTQNLHPADSAGRRWWCVLRAHVCGEPTGVQHAAGWYHPQGANDWVTSSRWLRRLSSRCIADCFLTQPSLCDYCTYFIDGINSGPGSGKPDAAEPNTALHIRLYYLCNLNPINSKPTQSSSARRGQRRRKEGACVWERREAALEISGEMKQRERNKSHHLSCVLLRIFLPLLWHSTIAFVLWEGEGGEAHLYLLKSLTIPKCQERGSPLPLFNLIFHSCRVTGVAGNHSSPYAREMKTKTCLRASFFCSFLLCW